MFHYLSFILSNNKEVKSICSIAFKHIPLSLNLFYRTSNTENYFTNTIILSNNKREKVFSTYNIISNNKREKYFSIGNIISTYSKRKTSDIGLGELYQDLTEFFPQCDFDKSFRILLLTLFCAFCYFFGFFHVWKGREWFWTSLYVV